ncbi:MAG: chromosome segregation protein SMC, partial [Gammaproteobacteria bacterium]|nr:chromosome segregation protein SMC [Gammaproteobacteria bacterium]
MRLSRIKLAGFKSFVDPTTLHFPSNLLGVVGPNGCGKSNVIDAVRWVLGESSAKHLRGDSMADVIFNGSSSRKPVGAASIELVFDNSDGSIGGQFASYNEVSIKRSVTRDGISAYYLNNTRCRRKDITHIFLGTGLGPRSYAIIEQGMISRLIEAKPEEMRFYLEDAAGVSKFKDRRRETENRMRHTRDNLDRLNDLREEVEKHLRHLNRQAATARRFKKLKTAERKLSAELLALKLRELEDKSKAEERLVRERETELEAAIAKQRAVEARIEKGRVEHTDKTEAFNAVQARYYKEGAEIARLEQAIQHGRELRQRQERDRDEAAGSLQEIIGHIERDEGELKQLAASLDELLPRLEAARAREHDSGERLNAAETAMQHWREGWEAFNSRAGAAQQVTHVEQARIEYLQGQIDRLKTRGTRLDQELTSLSIDALRTEIEPLVSAQRDHAAHLDVIEARIGQSREQVRVARTDEQSLAAELDKERGELQQFAGKLAALEALQRASSGEASELAEEWLRDRGIESSPRIAEAIDVDPDWQLAVETVLGGSLGAVCVEGLERFARALADLKNSDLTLVSGESNQLAGIAPNSLASHVRGPDAVLRKLKNVRVAADIEQALEQRATLSGDESVITPEGVWFGLDWITVDRAASGQNGALEREQQ